MPNEDLIDPRFSAASESGAKVETELSLSDLLEEMTKACTRSAEQLNRQMQPPQWPEDVPYIYTIPQMTLELRLQLSQKEGKIKSIFGSTTESSSLSTIKLDLVAVPRYPQKKEP
jgi:hypothetical protein